MRNVPSYAKVSANDTVTFDSQEDLRTATLTAVTTEIFVTLGLHRVTGQLDPDAARNPRYSWARIPPGPRLANGDFGNDICQLKSLAVMVRLKFISIKLTCNLTRSSRVVGIWSGKSIFCRLRARTVSCSFWNCSLAWKGEGGGFFSVSSRFETGLGFRGNSVPLPSRVSFPSFHGHIDPLWFLLHAVARSA